MTGRTRSRLVARLARRGGAAVARATVFAALIGSGGVGFLSSALLLWSGLSSMPVRYGVSAALGYATFLLILRVAVSAKRWNSDPDVDIGVPEVHLHDTGGDAPSVMFAGGR